MSQPDNCRRCRHLVIERGVCPPIATCHQAIGSLGCDQCGQWSEINAWKWSGLGRISCSRCGHAQPIPLRGEWRIGCCATDIAAEVIVPFQGRAECDWYEPLVTAVEAKKDDQGRLF